MLRRALIANTKIRTVNPIQRFRTAKLFTTQRILNSLGVTVVAGGFYAGIKYIDSCRESMKLSSLLSSLNSGGRFVENLKKLIYTHRILLIKTLGDKINDLILDYNDFISVMNLISRPDRIDLMKTLDSGKLRSLLSEPQQLIETLKILELSEKHEKEFIAKLNDDKCYLNQILFKKAIKDIPTLKLLFHHLSNDSKTYFIQQLDNFILTTELFEQISPVEKLSIIISSLSSENQALILNKLVFEHLFKLIDLGSEFKNLLLHLTENLKNDIIHHATQEDLQRIFSCNETGGINYHFNYLLDVLNLLSVDSKQIILEKLGPQHIQKVLESYSRYSNCKELRAQLTAMLPSNFFEDKPLNESKDNRNKFSL